MPTDTDNIFAKLNHAKYDGPVSSADRPEILEIRGSPHRCKISIVVTQLGHPVLGQYRIADH